MARNWIEIGIIGFIAAAIFVTSLIPDLPRLVCIIVASIMGATIIALITFLVLGIVRERRIRKESKAKSEYPSTLPAIGKKIKKA